MDTSVYVKSFITSTHYRRIAALPKDTPFTCSSAEICFNVRNVTLVSKQICLKQLKSITSQQPLLNGVFYISSSRGCLRNVWRATCLTSLYTVCLT